MRSVKNGQLKSRPNSTRNLGSDITGLRRTGLETERDGFLYVPGSFKPGQPAPVIVSLHGAGGEAHQGIEPLRDLADHTGTILLAPESQAATWDLIRGGYGKDVFFIDEALSDLFSLYLVDPKHIAIAGFSDGASYALNLGMANSELFTHIIAFSPGFMPSVPMPYSPPVFISHGIRDEILPIESTARNIVEKLRSEKIDVTYEEFDGGHTIPNEIGRSAFIWFLGTEAIPNTKGARVASTEAGIEFT